ncbi:MAG: hypothetical protein LBQ05_00750, partial [Christensenellaceae bacterium]|jgi:hypothetical protein|nr:hypothetical protein [Christensenellaceae bacterium]
LFNFAIRQVYHLQAIVRIPQHFRGYQKRNALHYELRLSKPIAVFARYLAYARYQGKVTPAGCHNLLSLCSNDTMYRQSACFERKLAVFVAFLLLFWAVARHVRFFKRLYKQKICTEKRAVIFHYPLRYWLTPTRTK